MLYQNFLLSFPIGIKRFISYKDKLTFFVYNFPIQRHTLCCRRHFSSNVYSCNREINELMNSGKLEGAVNMFNEMPEWDVVSWNIMISGHYRYGFVGKSLNLYNEMVSKGLVENPSTFSTVLSICSYAGFCRGGFAVHCRAIVLGFTSNLYVSSALIDLYMKMGAADVSLRLFFNLPQRNLATWNVVLRGLCENGILKNLSKLYKDMILEGVEPNGLTFCYLIQGCGSGRLLDEGPQLHCCVIKNGLINANLFVVNALVDFYSACGSFNDAKRLFEVIPPEDVISWNSMVSVGAANGYWFEALEIFHRMHAWGKKPSSCSFLGLLKLSSWMKNIFLGKQVHGWISKLGFDTILLNSALIDMYGKCGDIESSFNVFETVPEKSIESCNSLMTSLLLSGLLEDVLGLFGFVVDNGFGYDDVSLCSVIKAVSLSTSTSSADCSLLHCCVIKSGFISDNSVLRSLIDAYSRCGEVKFYCQIFSEISLPNVICFTSIISAHARNGLGFKCIEMLDEIIRNGLKPDGISILSVLMGCSHSGLVEQARLVFNSMQTFHGFEPNRQHYSCMVDILGRAGLFDEAEQLVKGTPWQNDAAIWSSLLRSCRIHKNEELGRRAAKVLMEVEPENPGVWLQASNFYSDIGDFESSKRFREIAVARKITREIGRSWIEIRHQS